MSVYPSRYEISIKWAKGEGGECCGYPKSADQIARSASGTYPKILLFPAMRQMPRAGYNLLLLAAVSCKRWLNRSSTAADPLLQPCCCCCCR